MLPEGIGVQTQLPSRRISAPALSRSSHTRNTAEPSR